ncbi:unnamed protein product [Prunus armeniaca]|uniref:F-box domain-containing protein n=1 Tax=Prunus armeniaca TaxID=36596 RepID=A0A6J5U8B5_PRUAR|nr:unnamed protein product [Prunus armeniaca]
MDRISQLPNSIMHQILFRLPAQDAVRMSFLSTTWKSLWNSLPVSEFNFCMESEDGLDQKRKRSEEESVTSVDESLRVLHEHEDQKRTKPKRSSALWISKLKNVDLDTTTRVHSYKIEASNLQTLRLLLSYMEMLPIGP